MPVTKYILQKNTLFFLQILGRRVDEVGTCEKGGRVTPLDPKNRRCVCGQSPRKCPFDGSVRTSLYDVSIYAWPSRGGVIILSNADTIDFEFLGLDHLNLPLKRLEDPDAEDQLCQRLLLLGAKWFDSEARYQDIARADSTVDNTYNNFQEIDAACGSRDSIIDDEYPPTMREKRWVKVGWPSTGGLWISELDTAWAGVDEEEEDNLFGNIASKAPVVLRLARTMDEQCELLRDHYQGRFYEDLDSYEGYASLKSWATKNTGEVGPLLQLMRRLAFRGSLERGGENWLRSSLRSPSF